MSAGVRSVMGQGSVPAMPVMALVSEEMRNEVML